MRILHLAHFESQGGIEALVKAMLPAIEGRGHENIVAYGGEAMKHHSLARLRQRHLPGMDKYANVGSSAIRELRALINEERPDVACIHSSVDSRLARSLLRAMPTVFFAHGYGGVCPSGGRLFSSSDTICNLVGVPDARCLVNAYRRGCNTRRPWRLGALYRSTQELNSWLPSAAAVVCASQYMADRYAESHVPRERIVVVPLPSPLSPRPLRKSAPTDPVVLFAGRLVPQKGAGYLLKAFSLVARRGRLLVCGTGSELPRLRKLAQALSINDSVTFLGQCDSMSDVYETASVVVVPSIWPEPFGLVGTEAMAHGVPVVAFRVGGVPEWLSHGETGYLVEPKDVVTMAQRIQSILDDEKLARRMGERAFEVATARFGIDLFVDRFLGVLRSSIAQSER